MWVRMAELSSRWITVRVLGRVAFLSCGGYVAVLAVLMALEDRLIYTPKSEAQRWVEPPPDCRFLDLELKTDSGIRIHARWFPCPDAKGVVLMCHGRGANLSLALMPQDVAAWQREMGLSLLIFDYPGYGRSEGRPSEAGCYAAAEAAYTWLTRERGVPPRQLLLLGRSLGTSVAVDLATRHPHRALVLISPFSSMPDEVETVYPLIPAHLLMRNRFDSLSKIARCPQPLLVVHGTRDRTVPFVLGQRLFDAAPEPKRFITVERAGHDESVMDGFFSHLRTFLADYSPLEK